MCLVHADVNKPPTHSSLEEHQAGSVALFKKGSENKRNTKED